MFSRKRITIIIFSVSILTTAIFVVFYDSFSYKLQVREFFERDADAVIEESARDVAEGNYRKIIEQHLLRKVGGAGKICSISIIENGSNKVLSEGTDQASEDCSDIVVLERSYPFGHILKLGYGFFAPVTNSWKYLLVPFFYCILFSIFMGALAISLTSRYVDATIRALRTLLLATDSQQQVRIPTELLPIKEKLVELVSDSNAMRAKLIDYSKLETLISVSRQVAHDIRSPLTALSVVANFAEEIPEKYRGLIVGATARITEIANDLLKNGKSPAPINNAPVLPERVDLRILLREAVEEKQLQYGGNSEIRLSLQIENDGIFVNVKKSDFQRVISNLINNAIEAKDKDTIDVVVGLSVHQEMVRVTIHDNGKGIPSEILQQLGEREVTYGKEGTSSGSGLGVLHAKKYIASIGGNLDIFSRPGEGTMILITLTKNS